MEQSRMTLPVRGMSSRYVHVQAVFWNVAVIPKERLI
jgi:hypothetical protein